MGKYVCEAGSLRQRLINAPVALRDVYALEGREDISPGTFHSDLSA